MAFGEYRGRSIGRAMRFLYEIDMRSDHCIFSFENGVRTVRMGHDGPIYCIYRWKGNTDIPDIFYMGEFDHLNDCKDQAYKTILDLYEKDRDHRVVFDIAACQLDGTSGSKYTECELRDIPKVGDIITVPFNGINERRKVIAVDDYKTGVWINTVPYSLQQQWKEHESGATSATT